MNNFWFCFDNSNVDISCLQFARTNFERQYIWYTLKLDSSVSPEGRKAWRLITAKMQKSTPVNMRSTGITKHFKLTKLSIKQKSTRTALLLVCDILPWFRSECWLSLPSRAYDTGCRNSGELLLQLKSEASTTQTAHTALSTTKAVEDLKRKMCTLVRVNWRAT